MSGPPPPMGSLLRSDTADCRLIGAPAEEQRDDVMTRHQTCDRWVEYRSSRAHPPTASSRVPLLEGATPRATRDGDHRDQGRQQVSEIGAEAWMTKNRPREAMR